MVDVEKKLKIEWRGEHVILPVIDVDRISLLDVILEYEDVAKREGLKLDFHYPTFKYVFNMKHHPLNTDKDLMTMFQRLNEKEVINIWVGTVMKPTPIYKTVLNYRSSTEKNKNVAVCDEEEGEKLPSLEELEDSSLNVRQQVKKGVIIREPTETTQSTTHITTQTWTTKVKKATSTKQKPPPKNRLKQTSY